MGARGTRARSTPVRPRIVVRLAEVDRWLEAHAAVAGWLSAAERKRLAGLRKATARDAYLTAHAVLRLALAELTATAPGELPVACPRGRPPRVPRRGGLSLSVSHTDGLAAVAAATGTRVGVDVERWGPPSLADELAASVLSPAERAGLAALPPGRRGIALVRAWCRKEAVLKAAAVGLSVPPAGVEVGVGPEEPSPSRVGPLPGRPDDGYAVVDVAAPPGFHGALAWVDAAGPPELDVRFLTPADLPD